MNDPSVDNKLPANITNPPHFYGGGEYLENCLKKSSKLSNDG